MKSRFRLSADEFDEKTFKANEIAANKSLTIASAALAGFLALIWLFIMVLSNTKILHTSNHFVHFGFPVAFVLLAIPVFLRKTKFIEHPSFKFIQLALFLFAISLINIAEPIHSILGFAIIIAGASHYYSRRMLTVAFIATILLLLGCLYAGTFIGDWDANLVGISEISAPDFLGIPKEEFVDSVATRVQVIQKIYETEGTNRLLNIFINYYLTRAGAITIIYLISLQLSGRTYRLLSNVSANVKKEEKMAGELSLAKDIQLSFIPHDFPDTEEYEILGAITSAKEVGGDFYDYFRNKKSEVIFDIGDVSGKGIPGSLTMMRAKTLMKSFALTSSDLSEVLTQTNRELCVDNDSNIFVTSVIGKLNLDSGEIILSNAAHNPPLIKRNGKYEFLKLDKAFVLGAFEETRFKDQKIQLYEGDQVIFYTDGVTEAMNENDEMFGEERLLTLFNENTDKSLKELFLLVHNAIIEFRGKAEQSDDLTAIGLLYKGNKVMKKEIVVSTLPENIDVLTEFVNDYLTKYTKNEKALAQINVAIDEIFSNIVKFAYHPEIGKAILRIELRKDPLSIRIIFIDHGRPFNPLDITSPDINMSSEDREIGGLGIFIVKKTMDEITYEYKDGQNILTIKKSL